MIKPNTHYDTVVIGGGAAGMMAAGRAGECGQKVLLIEKNDRLGKKLSITGGRRCNITNAEFDNRAFLENFPQAKQFLYSPFSKFNVESTFNFFEGRQLPIIIEDRKRAFPKSEKAEDVCGVLEDYIHESGNVDVLLNAEFKDFVTQNQEITGVKTSKGDFTADRYILATGGLAAPETGSTGEWLPVLRKVGHTVKEPNPNLSPLRVKERWVKDLMGLSVDHIQLRFIVNGKTRLKKDGRLLFTHFGISGPMVINSAYEVGELLKEGTVTAELDFFAKEDLGTFDKRLQSLFSEHQNKKLANVIPMLVPTKIGQLVTHKLGQHVVEKPVHSVTKEERKQLVRLLKELSFTITGTMGFEWSIIADGGVIPEEVDFRTMQSRVQENLYLIGDTISINRPSGGFSLQLCWTTAWIAGTGE